MSTIDEEGDYYQKRHDTTLELLPERKKRTHPSKFHRDERRYRRFVHDLNQQIHVGISRCLRENRFDTRNDRTLEKQSIIETRRKTSKSTAASSTISSRSRKDNDTIITSVSNRQSPMSLLQRNETKRLTDDVHTILTGPALKDFYVQFYRPTHHSKQSIRLKKSVVYSRN